MKNLYINDLAKAELLADLFNHVYGLPGCTATNPEGKRYSVRRTNGGIMSKLCKCTKDVEDPNCLFYSSAVSVIPGAGVFQGQGAITLTQEFIKLEELSQADRDCLYADYPPLWISEANAEEGG